MNAVRQSQPLAAYLFDGTRYDCGNEEGYFTAQLAAMQASHNIGEEAMHLIKAMAADAENTDEAPLTLSVC